MLSTAQWVDSVHEIQSCAEVTVAATARSATSGDILTLEEGRALTAPRNVSTTPGFFKLPRLPVKRAKHMTHVKNCDALLVRDQELVARCSPNENPPQNLSRAKPGSEPTLVSPAPVSSPKPPPVSSPVPPPASPVPNILPLYLPEATDDLSPRTEESSRRGLKPSTNVPSTSRLTGVRKPNQNAEPVSISAPLKGWVFRPTLEEFMVRNDVIFFYLSNIIKIKVLSPD